MLITIENNGPELLHTNYWDSPHASAGYVYASWNAGALRLLLPDSMLDELDDLKAGHTVIVTWGWINSVEGLEIMFEDDTDSPYAIQMVAQQCDRRLADLNLGHEMPVTAWGRAGRLAQWPGRFRVGTTLPDLSSWVVH